MKRAMGQNGFRWAAILSAMILAGILIAGEAKAVSSGQSADDLYQSALMKKNAEGDLAAAIRIFQDILARFPGKRDIAAKSQLQIGICFQKLGNDEAERAFRNVIDNYPEQSEEVREAKEKLTGLLEARSNAKGSPGEPVLRHILTWNDLTISGSVSADERYMTVTDWTTGHPAIRDLATGKERRLTKKEGWDETHPGYAFTSIWSPDYRRVAYIWVNANNESELHEIGLDDAEPRVICGENKGLWTTPIEWSVDGRTILAKAAANRQEDLRLISVADGSIRILKTFAGKNMRHGNAFLSPDGRSLAYSRPPNEKSRTSDIYLLSIADGREVPLVRHPAHDEILGWLPDGRGILFSSDRTGTTDAWVLPTGSGQAAGDLIMVKRNIGTVYPMSLTRDGKFFFSTPGGLRSIYTVTVDPDTGRPESPPVRESLTHEGYNLAPAWSPDGNTLAYVSWCEQSGGGLGVLCLFSPETQELREIPLDKQCGDPRWEPDGRHLLLQATVMEGQGIYRIDVQSGKMTEFLKSDGKKYLHGARVTPDGKTLIYGQDDSTERAYKFLARDIQSGRERELARTSFDNNTAALSPDGRFLAMILRPEQNKRTLEVMDFPDGSPKEILSFNFTGRHYIDLAWSPDGRFIYFSKGPDTGYEWSLYRVPRQGGDAQDLGLKMRRFQSLSVNPDGRRITFASIPPDGEFPQIWVMENFLPAIGKK